MPVHPGETFRPLTWRVENVPEGMSHEDLISCFHRDDQEYIKVKSLCPSVETPDGEEGDLTATVFFHPPETLERPPRIATDDMMNIDKEFFGFTPLYVPPPGKSPILADIIAVTGLAGHAFGSWAHSHERMWLRDYLPKDAPNTRVLTYGYPSKLQASTSVSILQDHTNTFVHRLIDMRESAQCESRPIIFVGHSLGCLIIKKALTGLENMGIARSRLPVRAFIFLGAPHRGLNVTALQTLVKGEPTAKLIAELEADSATLTDLNQGFAHVAKDIDILTCYETRSTKTAINIDGVWKREGPPVMMVSPNSAQQYYLKEKCVSVDADHSQIAKLKRGQNGVYPNVKSAIKHGLISTAKIMAGADAGLEPTAGIDKGLAKVQISEESEFPPQPPPYSDNPNTNTTPSRPVLNRAANSSVASSPSLADMRRENLMDMEEGDRERNRGNLTRTSTRTSVGPETPIELTRSSTRTSIGMETPSSSGIATSPDLTTPSRAPTLPKVTMADIFNNTQNPSIAKDIPKDEDIACFCNICKKDVTHDEFYYTCDDCAVDGLEEDGDGDYGGKPANDKLDTEDDNNVAGKQDDVYDDSFDVCQKCFASGLQGPDHGGHKFGKKMIVSYGSGNNAIFPYPERQVFMHDSNIVKALKEGDWMKVMAATRNGDNVNVYDTDGNTPLHLAIHLGLTACADVLLDAGASREIRDRVDQTPLHNAVLYNQVEILTILLDKGADANTIGTTYSDTALHIAAMNGQHDVVRILLNRGAAVNVLSTVGTPLLYAAMRGHKQSAYLLLEAGANPNLQIEEETDSQGPPLIGAASAGKPEAIRLLVEYGARIEDRTAEGYTALMHAAAIGQLETCETLLRVGANSRAKANDGRSVLAIAAQENKREIVELLLKHGAEIDEPDNDGDTALTLAMQAGQLEMVKLLRRCGAKIDQPDADGRSLLWKAVELGEQETVELLLKHGANIDTAGTDGVTPLYLASKLNLPKMVELLVQSGARVDKPDSSGETPLVYAVIEGFTEVCEELLRGNADPNRYFVHDGVKQPPLLRAAMANKEHVVAMLLKHGATVDLPDSKGETPLIYAIIEGYEEVCRELLNGGADPNQLTPHGATALMKAVQANKPEVVKLLLRSGAAVDMPDVHGETPLVYATIEGFTEICEVLLQNKADVDQFISTGDTPLMKVTKLNKPEIVELLLRHGATPDKPERKAGETPLIYAVIENYLEVCAALLSHGAHVDQLSATECTPLMKATIGNKPDMVKLLLLHGSTVDMPVKGESPLIYGTIEGYTAVCEALLLAKADVNQFDPTGGTPLFKAVAKNNPEMVKLLLKYGAEVDLPESSSGETPLMHGVLEDYIEVCEALLLHKADIEQVNRAGNTPLMAAAMNNKLESVKLLLRQRPRPFLDRMPARDGWTALTLAAFAGHYRVVQYLLVEGASGVPPPTFGKWKNFVFNSDVDPQTQYNILQLLREYKHR